MLLEALQEFEDLFDGTLGDWKTKPAHFELKSGKSGAAITAELSQFPKFIKKLS